MPYSEAIKCIYGVSDHDGRPASKYGRVGLYLYNLASCIVVFNHKRVETKILVTRKLPNIVQRHHNILYTIYKKIIIFFFLDPEGGNNFSRIYGTGFKSCALWLAKMTRVR